MLIRRFRSMIVLVVLLVGAIFWFSRPLVAVLVALLVGMGLWEFYTMAENKGLRPFKWYGTSAGVILAVGTYICIAYKGISDLDKVVTIILYFIVASLLIRHAFKKDGNSVIVNSAVAIFGIMYVSFTFTFIIKLRYLPDPAAGKGWVVALFCVTKIADIAAYVCGSKWGRHKLIPRISANKSIEGFACGIIASVLLALGFRLWFLQGIGLVAVIGLGILLGVVGQIGDLIESLMKRDAQVKDSGKLIPGIGGVLDLMDSLIFTGPAMYLYLKLVL